MLNASAARVYRLSLSGHTFLHVGDDGGLFEKPIETKEILLANSERVELLVRGTGAPGTRAVLQTLPYDRYVPQTRPKDWNTPQDLLAVQYTKQAPVTPVVLPSRLRVIPALDTAQATATRVMSLTQGLINGKAMDMARVDVSSKLGATEIWEIENLVGMDHPFHLHGFQFQVLDRNGVPEPLPELEGHRERAEARDGAVHRALRRLSGQVDVPLPHPGPRRPWDDGHSRNPITEEVNVMPRLASSFRVLSQLLPVLHRRGLHARRPHQCRQAHRRRVASLRARRRRFCAAGSSCISHACGDCHGGGTNPAARAGWPE